MISALKKRNTLSWIFIVLAHLNNSSRGRHVAIHGHIILIQSQPLFALTPQYSLISGEVTNTNFIVFVLNRSALDNILITKTNLKSLYTLPILVKKQYIVKLSDNFTACYSGYIFSELKRHARVEHVCRATCCKDHYCCSVDDTTRCLLRTMRVTLSIHPYMVHSVPFCPRGELCILFVQHNYRTGHRFHRSCTS